MSLSALHHCPHAEGDEGRKPEGRKPDSTVTSADENSRYTQLGIQLAGVNRLRNPRVGCFRRYVWSFLLILGAILTITTSGIYIRLYLDTPVKVLVSSAVEPTLELPGITICIKDKYDFHSLYRLWIKAGYRGKMPPDVDLRLLSNYTIEEIWREGGYELSRILKSCYVGPGRFCNKVGKWKETFTKYGRCYTFHDAYTISPGNFFGFYVKLKYRKHPYGLPFNGFLIGIHNPNSSADHFVESGFRCSIKKGKYGCYSLISYKLQERHFIDKKNNPCNSSEDYDFHSCELECLHNYITSISKCRLPYMDVEAALCQDRSQVMLINELLEKYELNGTFWTDHNRCNCLRSCSSKFFYWNADTTWREESKPVIKVYSNDHIHQWVREVHYYGIASLAGDIGGTFGLMLGASVLTLIEVIEVTCFCLVLLVKKVRTYFSK